MFTGSGRGFASKSGPVLARFKSKVRLPEKIPVQLLKDVPTVGVAGEIIRVRPAYMRNFLHHKNRAAYILKGQGPKIPIVERSAVEVEAPVFVAEETVEVVTKPTTPAKAKAGAMSLDELSSLFNTMKNKRARKSVGEEQSFTSSTEVAYTLSELKEAIPSPYTIQSDFPITKEYFASAIFNLSGNQVPIADMKLGQDKSFVSEITEAGKYKLIISSSAEKNSITIPLIVN
ncbi:uncharacterized protein CANTADRAFT_25872 [Suhomyces tanzawaensis NRRL Y-17324]|uniref:Ribosomal protein L9 domain-containing protein n=1 Tax=Suhomyces tanzawaensis NRRL Y-17324 TaxID=984487 RepID=A0A1E4SL08_9ASCO|nr:uncharacterized protein CANTADRAFT_25872 [Suhomyces tanzawaensis NRRL Y-17324]ODV80186.1 hypothetical protein CANTADRAFT_25872 [Suhomyces tanzawaensis NRRL Y-17324]